MSPWINDNRLKQIQIVHMFGTKNTGRGLVVFWGCHFSLLHYSCSSKQWLSVQLNQLGRHRSSVVTDSVHMAMLGRHRCGTTVAEIGHFSTSPSSSSRLAEV